MNKGWQIPIVWRYAAPDKYIEIRGLVGAIGNGGP